MPYGSYGYNTGMWLSVPAAVKSLSFQVRNLKLCYVFSVMFRLTFVSDIRYFPVVFGGKGTMFSDVPKTECLPRDPEPTFGTFGPTDTQTAPVSFMEFDRIFRGRSLPRTTIRGQEIFAFSLSGPGQTVSL